MRFVKISASGFAVFATSVVLATAASAASGPATICYSTQPSLYFNDHAADIKKIFVSFVQSASERRAVLHTGWDDGIIIRLEEQTVFDARTYPPRGKGLLYRDKYQFERHVPLTLPKGKTRLAVTSINSHGNWLFSLRITDQHDLPFPDVKFCSE